MSRTKHKIVEKVYQTEYNLKNLRLKTASNFGDEEYNINYKNYETNTNNFERTNLNYNNNDIINNSNYINNSPNKNSVSFRGSMGSEEIFMLQKNLIKKIKEKNNLMKMNQDNCKIDLPQKSILDVNPPHLTLDNFEYFEVSDFNNDENDDDSENKNILDIINHQWNTLDISSLVNSFTTFGYIEFNQLALRTINGVNYNTSGTKINIKLTLIGECKFWIFTRIFVNKTINESDNFDLLSNHNNSRDIFNKYTSLIKISKEAKSNRCFAELGTFYENKVNGKIYYKNFLKRQLIDYSHNNINDKFFYIENDSCEYNITVIDLGEEIIYTKIGMGSDTNFDVIKGNFYLPLNKEAKLLFGGFGDSIRVKNLSIDTLDKKRNDNQEQNEIEKDYSFYCNNNPQFEMFVSESQKGCNCCNII